MHVYAYAYACTHTHTHSRWAKDEMRIARISAWLPDNDAVLFFFSFSLSSLLPPPLRASARGCQKATLCRAPPLAVT